MKFFLILSLIAIGISFGSCTAAYKAHKENRFGWRPPDFKPELGTLLIVTHTRWEENQIKEMKYFMKQKYTYKYEFVSHEELSSAQKFADKNEYRFILYPTYELRTITRYGSPAPSESYHYYAHFFHDCLTNKNYTETLGGSFPVSSLKIVIKACLKPVTEPKH